MKHCEEMGEYTAADVVRKLIVHGLPPQQKKLLKLIKENPWITTPQLSKLMSVRLNHTGTMAKSLYSLGLVRREHKWLGNLVVSRYWMWHNK